MTQPWRSRHRRLAATAIGLLVAAATGPAAATCAARFRDLTQIAFGREYDGFSQASMALSVDFTVVQAGDETCTVAVGADLGQTGGTGRQMAMGGGRLSYQLYADSGRREILRDGAGASPQNLLIGQVSDAKTDLRLDFTADLPSGQIVPHGSYADQVRFTLYQLTAGQAQKVLDVRSVPVSARVLPVAMAEIVIDGQRRSLHPEGGRVGTLDFGTMETGETLGFNLDISGNADYRIRLHSEHGGVMRGVGSGGGTVDYAAAVDGSRFDLRHEVEIPFQAATAFGRDLNSHGVLIQLGDVSRALAGHYEDNLVVTIETR